MSVSDTQAGGHSHLVERLRKKLAVETDRGDSNFDDACKWMLRAETAERELALLRSQKEKLVEALEPFGELDGEGSEDFPDETPVVVKFGRTTDFTLKLGDIRRASAALRESGQ